MCNSVSFLPPFCCFAMTVIVSCAVKMLASTDHVVAASKYPCELFLDLGQHDECSFYRR
jgi:hypothetical protein